MTRFRSALLSLVLFLAVAGLRAQDDAHVHATVAATDTPSAGGAIVIHQSDRINSLMTDYATHKQPLKGFRVQVFLGDRAQAEDTRRSFLVRHPDIPAYLSYLAPNFRVRVGDLRDRLEAERLREQLKPEFPGLYVVPEDIELPRLVEKAAP